MMPHMLHLDTYSQNIPRQPLPSLEETQDEETCSQLQRLQIVSRPESLLPLCLSSTPTPLRSERIHKIVDAILTERNIPQALQRLAPTLAPLELDALLQAKGQFLLYLMNQPHITSLPPCIRIIKSKTLSDRSLRKIYCISTTNPAKTDFYIKKVTIDSGTTKRIIRLIPYPGMGSQEKTFALAQMVRSTTQPYKQNPSAFLYEARIVAQIHTRKIPYIISMQHLFCLPPDSTTPIKPALFMPDCTHGTLYSLLKTHTSRLLRMQLIAQVITSLIKLHSIFIYHNDLKLKNIGLVADNQRLEVRLLDFGSACFAPPNIFVQLHLCSTYPPPEMMLNAKKQQKTPATAAIDLWALGLLILATYTENDLPPQWELAHSTSHYETNLALFQASLSTIGSGSEKDDRIALLIQKLCSPLPENRPPARYALQEIALWIQEQNLPRTT